MTEKTMRAAVLDAPGEPLALRDIPVPVPEKGWVLIRVKAFGLNRSELHTRLGLAEDVTFPRVLGIEATGIVEDCPGGEFAVGQQVMAMMGGMGRQYDGGYAEFTSVPVGQVIPFSSDLPWSTLGAIPEMVQAAYGSLTVGLDIAPGETLLVRGGTSSVGMAAAVLAKRRGLTVFATTRNAAKASILEALGVDRVIIDDGTVAPKVRDIRSEGVDAVLELVGAPTLPDSLAAAGFHGRVCMTGMLSNQWTIPDFYPTGYIPKGVWLTGYAGDASDLPTEVLQEFFDAVAAGEAVVPIDSTYELADIETASARMEAGAAAGKLVVTP